MTVTVTQPPNVEEIPLNGESLRRFRPDLDALAQGVHRAAFDAPFLGGFVEGQREALIAHAEATCPYYRERPGERKPLDKAVLQTHLKALWSEAAVTDDVQVWKTSGSTGEPTRFLVDDWTVFARDIGFDLTLKLAGIDAPCEPNQVRVVRVSAAEGLGVWTRRFPLNNHARLWKFPVFDHPEASPGPVIDFLADHRPPILSGDPQSLQDLVRHWQAQGVTRYPYSLRGLISGANQLTPAVRSGLETFFGLRVTDCYGLSEVGIVASECSHGTLHCHTPLNEVEIAGPDGGILPEGELGEIGVTCLINGTFPLIRYRTGDMGRLKKSACPCGSVLPELFDFQGRKRRWLRRENGERFSPQVLLPELMALPVRQYQLVQDHPAVFFLNYRADSPLPPETFRDLETELTRQVGGPVTLTTCSHTGRLEMPGQKFQDIVCRCE